MVERDIGEQLIEDGWFQGSLIKADAAQVVWLERSGRDGKGSSGESLESGSSPGVWGYDHKLLAPDEYFVVASHPCDIKNSSDREPYVEAIRAYWTDASDVIHQARNNSGRKFRLRSRIVEGQKHGLVADATDRVLISKEALIGITPLPCFDSHDTVTPRYFREWLAERYNRPIIDDAIIKAVQTPIVNAINRLSKNHRLRQILMGIREIRFLTLNDAKPFQVQLLLMCDERSDVQMVDPEDVLILGGWLAQKLKDYGEAELIHCDTYDYKMISVHDYLKTHKLPLDHNTSPRDAWEKEDVRGEETAVAVE